MLSAVKQKNRLIVRSVYNSFGSDQRVKQFPLSPHTSIYKFPLPAITSIMTRFTGVGVTAGNFSRYLIVNFVLILQALCFLLVVASSTQPLLLAPSPG
jgi:hypothetical protein